MLCIVYLLYYVDKHQEKNILYIRNAIGMVFYLILK